MITLLSFYQVHPHGVNVHGLPFDSKGIIIDQLETYLKTNWTKPMDGKPAMGKLKVCVDVYMEQYGLIWFSPIFT